MNTLIEETKNETKHKVTIELDDKQIETLETISIHTRKEKNKVLELLISDLLKFDYDKDLSQAMVNKLSRFTSMSFSHEDNGDCEIEFVINNSNRKSDLEPNVSAIIKENKSYTLKSQCQVLH